MIYRGRYKIFDSGKIKTYPLRQRTNKVKFDDLLFPQQALQRQADLPKATKSDIDGLAKKIVACRRKRKPVILFTGAHLIKNGLGPLIVDLVEKNIFTLVAGNGATAIHDFELALLGETSEFVPDALGKGLFGMAYEFAYMNTALKIGNTRKWGYGESLARMIVDSDFRDLVFAEVARADSQQEFLHPEVSVLAACFAQNIPFTVHAGIGVDVIDQHPTFDGEAKGGCSGRDFLIFVQEITKFVNGGVFVNVGSAVQGPEVLLKSVSMTANTGFAPENIICADFDLREFRAGDVSDEEKMGYYFRDQKSVVTRIPAAFHGNGIYIQGDQRDTILFLYQRIIQKISAKI